MKHAVAATKASRAAEPPPLVERDRELELLRGAIDNVRGGAGETVVIEGPAGIGKTALLDATQRSARGGGMLVLRARASELEQEFAFGVVRQLFDGLLACVGNSERAALLNGAAGLASSLFDPTAPAAIAERLVMDRGFTLIHGLHWLTANLAEEGPVMIALDDAHWADPPSLRFLAYLSARNAELPVLVVVTVRAGEPSPVHELFAALSSGPGARTIAPRPLSEGAVATLVRSRLGERAAGEFCTACTRASAGNPFLLRALITQLETDGVEPGAASAVHVEGVRPASVSRAVLARLGPMGAEAGALARAVAVLETATMPHAAGLAKLGDERARQEADRLRAVDVFAPSDRLAFTHPLLRRAVYESIPPAARADGHRRAGLALAAEGVPSARIAAHLVRAAPANDPQVVALLRTAARDTLADGDPDAAAGLLRRALREPPLAELRGAVLAELGRAEVLARDQAATEHLSEALELTDNPEARVPLACALGELLVWGGQPVQAHALLTRVIDELPDDAEPSLRAVLETIRVTAASVDRRLVAEVDSRLPALRELAVAAGPAGRELSIFEACWRAQRGPYSGNWRELLDRGLDGGRFVAEQQGGSSIVSYATAVLALADEVARAEAMLALIHADAGARGSIQAHLTGLTWGALLALRRGALYDAESDAGAAFALARSHQVPWALTWTAAFLGQALLERGALELSERVLEQASIERVLGTSAALHALLARGRLRLAQGRRAEAVEDLRAAKSSVIVDNPSYVPLRSTLALALAPDDPVQARSLVAQELARARELGQPRGVGMALRASGLLERGEHAIGLLGESVDRLRGSPARLELARALCDLGATMRRQRQRSAAREPLREGLELAQRCGAQALVERAQAELLATGARPRRERLAGSDALTPSERRVAELAASGVTNREIAQGLFITVKTVGTHLGHIYQKLDLQGEADARERIGARLEEKGAVAER